MWRSLLAGLVTVGALVLLFVGSFGDPVALFRGLPTGSPVVPPPMKSTPTLSEAQGRQATAARRQAAATPQPAEPPAQQPAEPPAQPDEATLQQRRDLLLRQLQDLQTKVARAAEDTVALRSQADQAWDELDALRKRRAGDQPEFGQASKAPPDQVSNRQQSKFETVKPSSPKEAAADRKPPEGPVSNPASPIDATTKETTELLTVPDQAAARQRQRFETLQEVKVVSPAPPTAGVASSARSAQAPPAQPTAKPPPAEFDARAAVLARLRRQAPSRGGTAHVVPEERPLAPVEQPVPPPRQRLLDARTALAAGRVGDAEKLLQQAQVQLVLRPVSLSQDASATGSVAAGQVAEALSMLGAGDMQHAMHYINLAAAQADQAPTVTAVSSQPYRMPQ